MSSPNAPPSNLVDLRHWREERDRRLRQTTAETELPTESAPGRISWPFRILALIGGIGFLAFGAFLAGLPWLLRVGGGGAWSFFELALLIVGGAIALFGIDLGGRGVVGREWTRSVWRRIREGLVTRRRRIARGRDTIAPGSLFQEGVSDESDYL